VPNQPDLAVAATLAQFAQDLHDADGGVDRVVSAVVEFAAQTIACSFAGVVLTRRAGRVVLAATTSPAIDGLSRLGIFAGSPLVGVARGGAPVVIGYQDDDSSGVPLPGKQPGTGEARIKVSAEEQAAADAAGVQAATHVPLKVASGPIGALSLYDAEPISPGSRRFALAELVAQHGSIAIAAARYRESMSHAVEARTLVGQAVGILMQRFDVDAGIAFQVLDRHSQHSNTKLRRIAQYVLEHRQLPDLHQ
jgi:GAF domain-containing protein